MSKNKSIEIDYRIIRNDGKKEIIFKPEGEIKKIIDNITPLCIIEGPSTIGKSKLMDMIIASFFGYINDQDILNEKLKHNVKRIVDPNDDVIWFKISVKTKDGLLVSEKKEKDKEFKLSFNGKRLIPDSFGRKFRVIYDIPTNPRERIRETLREVRKEIESVLSKIEKTIKILAKLGDMVSEAEKLEKTIKQIETLKKQKSIIEKKLRKIKEQYSERIVRLRKAEIYYNSILELNDILKRSFKVKKVTTDIIYLEESIKKREKEVKKILSDLRRLVKNISYKNKLNVLSKIDTYIDNYDTRNIVILRSMGSFCISILNDIKAYKEKFEKDNEDKINKLEVISQLLYFFTSIRQKFGNITIPGIEKTVDGYIYDLEKEKNFMEELNSEKTSLDKIIENMELLYQNIKQLESFISTLNRYKKQKLSISEDAQIITDDEERKIKSQIKLFNQKIKQMGYTSKTLKNELKKVEFPDDLKAATSTKVIENIINLKEKEIEKLKKDLILTDETISKKQKELDEIKKYRKYKINKSKLKKLQESFHLIQREIKIGLINYIISIEEGNTYDTHNRGTDILKFETAISTYLAKKIKELPDYNGKIRKIKKIEIKPKDTKFVFTDGSVVYESKMATGYQQKIHITGLLTRNDKRKIIAVFDEASTMDNETIYDLVKKVARPLFDSGKLILFILVRNSRDKKARVIDLLKTR